MDQNRSFAKHIAQR